MGTSSARRNIWLILSLELRGTERLAALAGLELVQSQAVLALLIICCRNSSEHFTHQRLRGFTPPPRRSLRERTVVSLPTSCSLREPLAARARA